MAGNPITTRGVSCGALLSVLGAFPARASWHPVCTLPNALQPPSITDEVTTPANVYWSAFLMRIIQLPVKEFRKELARVPIAVTGIVPITAGPLGFQGAVVHSQDVTFIVLRGTQDFIDPILNADFPTVRGKGFPGRLVQGFHTGFRMIWPQLNKALTASERKPVWLTAHSLGGTLAQYAAYQLHLQHFPIYGVYGYGSPVSGDGTWAQAYNAVLGDRTLTHGFGLDITPHVPPVAAATDEVEGLAPRALRKAVRGILMASDYTRPGRYFIQDLSGPAKEMESMAETEKGYWREVGAFGIPMPMVLLKKPRLLADHESDNYLCGAVGGLANP